MALRIAAEKVDDKKPGPRCGLGKVIADLDADDIAFLDGMFKAGKTAPYIAEVLQEDGHHISHFTVRRHQRRECSCP